MVDEHITINDGMVVDEVFERHLTFLINSELALFAWTRSKGDNNPWRCAMAKRQRIKTHYSIHQRCI